MACDFFTVETAWLRTLYVLVFIELGSRRIHLSPATAHPESAWVTQQARNLALDLDGHSPAIRFVIRDRDAKYSRSFDAVLRSEGMRVIRTPFRAPNANAHAERVIETMRAECLDWTLIQRSAASRSNPPDLCRALQPRATPSRPRPRPSTSRGVGPDGGQSARRSPTGPARWADP
jgi:transposase InsO family protein